MCKCAGAGRDGAGGAHGPFRDLMTSQGGALPFGSAGLVMVALEVWGDVVDVEWLKAQWVGPLANWAGGCDQGPVVTLCKLGPSYDSPQLGGH